MPSPTHLNAREFALKMGVHYQTVRSWLASGELSGERTGRDYEIPVAELSRMLAERRKVELDEDRLALALDYMTLKVDRRKEAARERVANATERFARAYTALSPAQRKDLAVLLPLIEPLTDAVNEVKQIPVLVDLLHEMNRETRDDEFVQDFGALIEQEQALVKTKQRADDERELGA